MTYTYDEAYANCLHYFAGDELSAKVVVDKYLLRDKDNNLVEKSPEDKHRRIAAELYRIECQKFDNRKKEIESDAEFEEDWNRPLSEQYIFSLLDNYKFIVPQGSIMAGLGDKFRNVSLSNCFVVPSPYDSYAGILTTDEHIVQISKRRGGIGYDISTLRPEGIAVNNCARTTSGTISFMERFSNTGREVGQNGRRAAQMITIDVHHPDVEKFINIKRDLSKVTGANISIRLSDEFLNAVQDNQTYEQRWPLEGKKQISRYESARHIWDSIISAARDMAEPGLLFWNNIINESPADCYWREGYRTVCTNPCSELPLSEFDSCRLLVLNLFSYVINPFKSDAKLDKKRLYLHAQIAQRFMDHIVDLEIECVKGIIEKIKNDPEPDHIKEKELTLWQNIVSTCQNGRRTGTGITALGDTLAALDIRYGSDLSIEQSEEIYKIVKFGAYRSSVNLAQVLNAFPVWNHDREKECPFLTRIKDEHICLTDHSEYGLTIYGKDLWNDMKKYGRRNISLLTIAPTGTLSILTQTTSGIEPVFQVSYTRRKKINDNEHSKVDFVDEKGDRWQEFTVYHHGAKLWMDITGEKDLAASPYFNAGAEEINWENRVKLQAAVQRHCDHSISSTINLPEDVTVDEVKKIYETAWKSGCKGITVYRKNSRSGVLVDSKKKDAIVKTTATKRPEKLPCDVHHISVKGEPYFVAVGLMNEEPYEVFAGRNNCIDHKVKGGFIIKSKRPKGYKAELDDDTIVCPITMACTDNEETVTRLISMSLRHGASIQFVAEQLGKTNGEMTSFSKAIARVLKKYIVDGTKASEKCSECGAQLVFENGCVICKSCGMSKCN